MKFNFIEEKYVAFRQLVKNTPWLLGSGFVIYSLNAIDNFFSTYVLISMQKIIDLAQKGAGNLPAFYFELKILITIIIASIILGWINDIITFHRRNKFTFNNKNFMMKIFYGQDYKFFNKYSTGEILSRFDNEALSVNNWIEDGLWSFLTVFTDFMINFIAIFRYSHIIAFIVVIVSAISFLSTRFINNIIVNLQKELNEISAQMEQFYIEAISAFTVVKQFNIDKYILEKYEHWFKKIYVKKAQKMMYVRIIYQFCISMFMQWFPVALLLICIVLSFKGHYTVGVAIAIYTLVNRIKSPINAIIDTLSSWKMTKVLSTRLNCFFEKDENEQTIEYKYLDRFDSLSFGCSEFSYDGNTKILKNVKFRVNKGDLFCIKGVSGIGKSTILSFIIKFIKSENVDININDINIKYFKDNDYYKNVKMLSQSPFIFKNTIKNNITLEENFSEDLYKEVIEVSQLNEFIKEYGDNHILTDNAKNISGGQKQRIGLARTLIRKPKLLLLDEPTAALDEKTSNNLVISLQEYAKKYDITLIIITHSSVFDSVATQILDLNKINS